MTIYEDIKSARRLIWAGALLGYGTAVTIAVLSLGNSRDTPLAALAFLAVLSIPSTIALISLDRRPSLLPAAATAAGLLGLLSIASPLAWVLFVALALWVLANRRRPVSSMPSTRPGWWRPLLGAAALVPLLIMFVHLDPVCTVTDSRGEIVRTEPDATASEGWVFPPRLYSTATGSPGDGNVTTCASDRVEPWEAAASILASVAVVGIAARWPVNTAPVRESGAGAAVGA